MPVNWKWTQKMGVLTFKNSKGQKYSVNLYKGNCLGVLIYDYKEKDENGKLCDMYEFIGFWNDKTHLKRNLGLQKNGSNEYMNFYLDDGLCKLELNSFYDEVWDIAKLFSKAFKGLLKITMYYKKQG